MNELIRVATAELVRFLSAHLPDVSDKWWEDHVVDKLSFQQQRMVQERKYERLEQLDLADLLRVLDQNWFELRNRLQLPQEGRNCVREFQTVRNNWAHASIEQTPASDTYRATDTLDRLLNMLRREPSKISLKRKRLKAAMNQQFRTSVIVC